MPWFLIFISTDSETRKLIFILKFISASDDKNFYLFEKKEKGEKKSASDDKIYHEKNEENHQCL